MINVYRFPIVNLENEECIICTEKLENAREINCKHHFHVICLNQWLEKGNKSCPLCRTEIDLKDTNLPHTPIWSFAFRLNSTISNWLPNISFRIVRA